jgi:hypothetical protein
MSELKRLDIASNSFEANGRKYLIHPSVTIERFKYFEKLQVSIGFNADYTTLATGIRKAYDDLQKFKGADASVTLYNLMEGIEKKRNDREHEVLLLCSLFVCREGENLAEWNETEAVEKIADWKAGYDVADFFDLAWRLVRGFTERLRGGSGSSLDGTTAPTIAMEFSPNELPPNTDTTLKAFGSN